MGKMFQGPVKGERGFAPGGHHHFARNGGVFANGFVDFALFMVQHAIYQGVVKLVRTVVFKLHRQVAVCGFVAGEAQDAAGFSIQSMHDKHFAVLFFQFGLQALLVAKTIGNGQQAGGFIDDKQVFIFVKNGQNKWGIMS
jgi:hypothetical protein